MKTDTQSLARLRLLHFLSPALPVGSYSYSQGLEWAVEAKWVVDESSFIPWIASQIASVLAEQELPLLVRLYNAVMHDDLEKFNYWCQFTVALRDTAELRKEEQSRADAYLRVLEIIEPPNHVWHREFFAKTPLASIAYFAVRNAINMESLLEAYAHVWLETNVVSGVKIIPLGQSAGQRILFEASPKITDAIATALQIDDESVGISMPALSHASCHHETQYSRVYRS